MNYTVIGAAKSGIAAAMLAQRLGDKVFVTESKTAEAYEPAVNTLKNNNIEFEFGGNSSKALANCDCVITSPGVPPTAPIIIEAEKRGIQIISELEFGYRNLNNKIIAITGTNGKTTTTSLTAHILNKGGAKAVAAGNIGTPLSDLVGKISDDTIVVAEVSSFQLDRIDTFRPEVAMILNLSPDHLYYHKTMESYAWAKWKISSNMNENNLLILNGDDCAIDAFNFKTNAQIARFSLKPVDGGIFVDDGAVKLILPGRHKTEEIMLVSELGLPGTHNLYNSMAAALAARAFEIRNENIRDSLMTFEGVEHRLEFVRTLHGVDYVNDSKATNVNATWYALSSYEKPVIWIAGGRGDSNDYFLLNSLVEKHVKAIIAIGEEADAIFNHYCSMVRVIKADTMEEAVWAAREIGDEGDVALFTPACKSFDMFMNYEHRGEVFKEIVHKLV